MSLITIIGDVHGKIKQYRKIVRNLPPHMKSIQVGDMGIGFKGVRLYPLPPQHKFFRGNHDSPKLCRKNPAYIGDWGFIPEDSLFWVAGAWSIDYMYRTEGVSWWRDEELDIVTLNQIVNKYEEVKPRFVLTHEAPSIAAIRMLQEAIAPSHDNNPTTIEKTLEQKEKYQYYKAKLGCKNTRTSQAFQTMLEIHAPEKWIFGHYHMNKIFNISRFRTEFQCLGELSTYILDTGDDK